jgi:hypothetical protein
MTSGDWSSTCTVQQGDDSSAVLAIQLTATLESPVCNTNIDGIFGPGTVAEVEQISTAQGTE